MMPIMVPDLAPPSADLVALDLIVLPTLHILDTSPHFGEPRDRPRKATSLSEGARSAKGCSINSVGDRACDNRPNGLHRP
jgi:hypothetical protein